MKKDEDTKFYRNEVLDLHKLLEDNLLTLIQMAFRVKEPKSLRNNYTKLDLLMQVGIIEKEFQKPFQLFSRIRNHFIHELGCDRFVHLPVELRQELLAHQDIDKRWENDDEKLLEATKSLFNLLMKDFISKVSKAMERGYAKENLRKSLDDLLDYVCDKYPQEKRDYLKERFKIY